MNIERNFGIKVIETIMHYDDADDSIASEEPDISEETFDLASEFARQQIADMLAGLEPSCSEFGPTVWYTKYDDQYNGTVVETTYHVDQLPIAMQAAIYLDVVSDQGRRQLSALNRERVAKWCAQERMDLIQFACGYLVAVEESGRVCSYATAHADVQAWFYANYEALAQFEKYTIAEMGYYLYERTLVEADLDPGFVALCETMPTKEYDKQSTDRQEQEEEVMAATDDLEIEEEDECEECGEYAECSVCEDCGALICESCEETHECDDEDDDDDNDI